MVAISPVVSEEKSFEIVDGRRTDGRTDDGRTTEPSHPISSPGAFGSGELKKKTTKKNFFFGGGGGGWKGGGARVSKFYFYSFTHFFFLFLGKEGGRGLELVIFFLQRIQI